MSLKGRALVTGGAGFLGAHMCERMLDEGFEVLCLDNFLTGSLKNISRLSEQLRFNYANTDISTPFNVEGPVSLVIHLASPASPVHYQKHPIQTLMVGSIGTYHALEIARCNSATFLLASSSEVYGDPQINPQPEDYWGHVNSIGQRSVYDEAKRFSEALAAAYCREHDLDVRIARIFNTYGPGMQANDGRAIPNFMVQALTDTPLTLYGDGSQTRSLCYVDDLIEGLFQYVTSQNLTDTNTRPETTGKPMVVNFGNPEEVTILGLAKRVVSITGSKSSIVYGPLPEDDPKIRRPDITRARELLGWEPKTSLIEGLERALPYFQDLVKSL